MLTSACDGDATVTFVVAELLAELGSPVVLLTVGVLVMMVPGGVVGFTFTTNGKLTEALTAMVCPTFRVHVKVPVPPTAIVLHVQPAGGVKETSVVFVGIVSVKVAFVEAIGPLFKTACV